MCLECVCFLFYCELLYGWPHLLHPSFHLCLPKNLDLIVLYAAFPLHGFLPWALWSTSFLLFRDDQSFILLDHLLFNILWTCYTILTSSFQSTYGNSAPYVSISEPALSCKSTALPSINNPLWQLTVWTYFLL